MKNIRKNIVSFLFTQEGKEAKLSDIVNYTGVSKNDKDRLKIYLNELIRMNILEVTPKKKYRVCVDNNKLIGIFKGTSKDFGFVTPFTGEEDYYVYHKHVNGALDGDLIIGKISRPKQGGKRAEVRISEILEGAEELYIGTFSEIKDNGFVILDNGKISHDIFISKRYRKDAKDEDKVLVKITTRASKTKKPAGEIVEILGHKDDVGMDILSIIKKNNISTYFPEEVDKEVSSIPQEVSEEAIKNRLDLREELIVTIDGEDSKDLDDAISIQKLDNGNFKLGVHIADVAHYVKENSALDIEAQERATSVYLVDRVIPMLPKELSNGICSLHPHVDRLTLSCIMEVNLQGTVVNHEIKETIISSKERMTYTNVNKILTEDDKELNLEYQSVVPMLNEMEELASILMKKRENRGSIDFDSEEIKIILDEHGKPVDIKPYERNIATRIIEEFMILTNETIAEFFCSNEIPFVYRVHETPDGEKISGLQHFVKLMGHSLEFKNTIQPRDLQNLLNSIKDSGNEFAINQMVLRSLQKAKYSSNNIGHFGLASEFYSHFTSPIRRYPDLQIHRIIKKHLHGNLDKKYQKKLETILSSVCENSTKKEISAQESERDSVNLKKAEYMSDKINVEYDGVVVGVTEYGIYIQLPNKVEGFVHVSKMNDDYYYYNEEIQSLIGEKSDKTFTYGTKVKIEVERVDVERRQIDFKIID